MGAHEANLLSRAQAAVDAATAAYSADGFIDLEAQVAAELATRDLHPQVGDPMVEVLADHIRSGSNAPLQLADGPADLEGEKCGDCGQELLPTVVGTHIVPNADGAPSVQIMVDLLCETPDCLSRAADLAPASEHQPSPHFGTHLS